MRSWVTFLMREHLSLEAKEMEGELAISHL